MEKNKIKDILGEGLFLIVKLNSHRLLSVK